MDSLHRTVALLGLLLPALATLADDSARLRIGGVVPPRQRAAVIQMEVTTQGQSVTLLQTQNNSALGYTVTVETKTLLGKERLVKQSEFRSPGWSGRHSANGVSSANVVRIVPAVKADSVVVTIASQ